MGDLIHAEDRFALRYWDGVCQKIGAAVVANLPPGTMILGIGEIEDGRLPVYTTNGPYFADTDGKLEKV